MAESQDSCSRLLYYAHHLDNESKLNSPDMFILPSLSPACMSTPASTKHARVRIVERERRHEGCSTNEIRTRCISTFGGVLPCCTSLTQTASPCLPTPTSHHVPYRTRSGVLCFSSSGITRCSANISSPSPAPAGKPTSISDF